MTSSPNGQMKDTYTLQWQVESYAPVQEYRVMYKNSTVTKHTGKIIHTWFGTWEARSTARRVVKQIGYQYKRSSTHNWPHVFSGNLGKLKF